MANIPERLLRNGRAENQIFDTHERLFFRFRFNSENDSLVGKRISPSAIWFPDLSTNRELCSEQEDVLLPNFLDWGIASFEVGALPAPITPLPDGKLHELRPHHDPEENNYSHTEVRCFKGGIYKKTHANLNDHAKKIFRTKLSEVMTILKSAATSSSAVANH